ncbi:hypothetical protein HPO96_23090 [Kribbella sandramycini]|uniref:Uncharacterized protein n=1 Tax=Kribbella sandramycini TaxID=60450 RepID=A0A7Y4L476_9ACTN|nr:hypothetical protein [Kribbella sandramycini]MBB6566196.1 hypothetical protein [Kribbella sandramycini]NOL43137.1 hypothetical protein [Kribbella sandramycini]
MRNPARILAAAVLAWALVGCSEETPPPVAPSPGVGETVAVPTESPSASAGPGATEPGIRLTAVPRPDGAFDLIEDVLLPTATDLLQLQVPASGELLPGMMTRTTPRATDLQVMADDQPVAIETPSVDTTREVPLAAPATKLRLTYRLSGSAVRRTAQKPRRANAALRPLLAAAEGTLPTTITVAGGLLNAVCPLLPETRCAMGNPPALAIQPDLPAAQSLVVVQLDLP